MIKIIQKNKILNKNFNIINNKININIYKFNNIKYNLIFNLRLNPLNNFIKIDFHQFSLELEVLQ